jgi:hypothetical protein
MIKLSLNKKKIRLGLKVRWFFYLYIIIFYKFYELDWSFYFLLCNKTTSLTLEYKNIISITKGCFGLLSFFKIV